jgi:hypothetical protein
MTDAAKSRAHLTMPEQPTRPLPSHEKYEDLDGEQ